MASGRRRPALVAALAALLALPLAQAAPYLQVGYDAARTGATPDAGPAVDDVVFELEFDAPLAAGSFPLLRDGRVYLTLAREDLTRVVAVDLATAAVETVLTLPGAAWAPASDGRQLFLSRGWLLESYDLDDGTLLWTWEHPRLLALRDGRPYCVQPAVHDGSVFLACLQDRDDPAGASDAIAIGPDAVVYVVRVNAADGTAQWISNVTIEGRFALPAEAPAPAAGPGPAAYLYLPTVVADVVVVTVEELDPRWAYADRFIALAAQDGRFRWSKGYSDVDPERVVDLDAQPQDRLSTSGTGTPILPTGNREAVFLFLDHRLVAVDPASGGEIWDAAALSGIQGSVGGFALAGGSLFLGFRNELYHFDTDARAEGWSVGIGPAENWGGRFLVANATLFGPAGRAFYAVDARTGDIRWRHDMAAHASGFGSWSVGEGVVARVTTPPAPGNGFPLVPDDRAILTVLGRTAASIVPRAEASSLHPAPRQTATVDLSASLPGVLGPPTEFRADWGDGTVDDWQASPVLSHVFDTVAERQARFHLRNAQGQTASVTLVFDVGGQPPPQLNALQRAFAPENYDLTFGLLGVALALGGGAFAFARGRARRRRVQREADAIEATYASLRERPVACEAALAERRARVRGLGFDGLLDQGEVLVLDRRIDELSQRLRLDAIEEQFGFLSVGMARTLREMLADGRVQAWERAHFFEALARDAHLTAEQKERVRAQIDEWFDLDGAGRADAPP